jgi:glyoxylase-like metal-dependent hydrolase (beta-lactamase superfamily II)
MQPLHWQPPVELSEPEEQIVKWIRRAKLFVFLRHHRHELLDETFQVLHTPGHTPEHVSYLLFGPGSDTPSSLFSG